MEAAPQQGAKKRGDLGFGFTFRFVSAERRGRECEGRSMVDGGGYGQLCRDEERFFVSADCRHTRRKLLGKVK